MDCVMGLAGTGRLSNSTSEEEPAMNAVINKATRRDELKDVMERKRTGGPLFGVMSGQ